MYTPDHRGRLPSTPDHQQEVDVDITLSDPIQLEIIDRAATQNHHHLNPADYVALQAIAGATAQLHLGFTEVVELEVQHIDAGDYTPCGYEWDSGIIHPDTREPVTVACCRISEHATVAVAGRESHAGYLPSGSLITVDSSTFTAIDG
jgi:hypothetical protein